MFLLFHRKYDNFMSPRLFSLKWNGLVFAGKSSSKCREFSRGLDMALKLWYLQRISDRSCLWSVLCNTHCISLLDCSSVEFAKKLKQMLVVKLVFLCISCSQDNTDFYIKYTGDLNICFLSTVGYPACQIFKKHSKIISGKCLIPGKDK